jgi:hypothetical protein
MMDYCRQTRPSLQDGSILMEPERLTQAGILVQQEWTKRSL